MEKSENKIQQEIVVWFNNGYCLKFHKPRFIIAAIPNGGKRDAREAKTLKNTGLLRGASDLFIVGIKNGVRDVLFIETKKPGGYQSNKQEDFECRVTELGFTYILVDNLDDAKIKIKKYFGLS